MYAREEPGVSTEITASPAADHSDASPSPKKSRRSVQKRVVSVPVLEGVCSVRAKGNSEASPPSDSWAWRKYGQKPIKGSPYPRGYYRCSSSKLCPARKKVERSRTDPTKFIITYSSDHNHPWSVPKNQHHHGHNPNSPASGATAHDLKTKAAEDPAPADATTAVAVVDPVENFSDLIVEEPSLLMLDNFRWTSNLPAAAADDGLLYGPLFGESVAALLPDDVCDKFSSSRCGAADEEEDALFAGLGELPECSVVFRGGFFNLHMRGGDDGRRCGLEAEESAAGAAAASWCGSTG